MSMFRHKCKQEIPTGYGRITGGTAAQESAYIQGLLQAAINAAEIAAATAETLPKPKVRLVGRIKGLWARLPYQVRRHVRNTRYRVLTAFNGVRDFVLYHAPGRWFNWYYGPKDGFDRVQIQARLREAFKREGINDKVLAGTFHRLAAEHNPADELPWRDRYDLEQTSKRFLGDIEGDDGSSWRNPYDLERRPLEYPLSWSPLDVAVEKFPPRS
jgi:hypothetical protein